MCTCVGVGGCERCKTIQYLVSLSAVLSGWREFGGKVQLYMSFSVIHYTSRWDAFVLIALYSLVSIVTGIICHVHVYLRLPCICYLVSFPDPTED